MARATTPDPDPSAAPQPAKAAAVPGGRLARLARLGGMAGGVAGAMAADGARHWLRGERPALGDLLLTPANALRVADELSRLRGAAMKVGQLLSMDAGELLPPELAGIFARLRADAAPMPPEQLDAVLAREWSAGWRERFQSFPPRPIAAASIGQVHRARHADGRDLAIKVQYPGVRASIDGDIDNLHALLRASRLLPPEVDVAPLLAEAKRQLREEADYPREAEQLARFAALLADRPEFVVPAVHPDLSTASVLAMSFVEGVPIEAVAHASQAERDRTATLLIELALDELFDFGLMQTDPNFANYRYQFAPRRIVLLDFGAVRAFGPGTADAVRALLAAALAEDPAAAERALEGAGLLAGDAPPAWRRALLDMFALVAAALRTDPFDFGDPALLAALRDRSFSLAAERVFPAPPPADLLFLQRKAAGLFLLASRLRACVPLRAALAARA